MRPRGTLFAVEFLINSLVAKAGMGAGFSGLSGLRAFMPLGLLGLASHLDLWAGLDLGGTPFALLENSWVIAALLILAAFEMAADKVPLLDSIQDVVATPLRAIAGALIFAAIMQNQGTAALMASGLAGGAIAATAHAGKTVVRAGATTTGAGVANPFISFFEDLLTFIGSILLLLVPMAGILIFLFLVFLVYRISRKRKRKYEGLRILRE